MAATEHTEVDEFASFLNTQRVSTVFQIKKEGLFKDSNGNNLHIGCKILLRRRKKSTSDEDFQFADWEYDEQSGLMCHDDGDTNIVIVYMGYFRFGTREMHSLVIVDHLLVNNCQLREYTEIVDRWVQEGNHRGGSGNIQSGDHYSTTILRL